MKSPQAIGAPAHRRNDPGRANRDGFSSFGSSAISTPPEEWRPEKASSLGGVIVVPQNVTENDLEVLKNRNIPYLIFTETNLPGPRISWARRRRPGRLHFNFWSRDIAASPC